MIHPTARRRATAALASATGIAVLLVGCASPSADRPIQVGTTAEIVSLDPAATRDATTIAFLHQLYPRLLEHDPATGEYLPSLASTAEFTSPTEYTVTLPPGLAFANGDELSASDVVFSIERQVAIQEAAGTVSLLRGLASVAALDSSTVVFTLRRENDATFPGVLAGPAGAILDEEVFSADAVTDDEVIVAGGGSAGDWRVASAAAGVVTLIEPEDDPQDPTGQVVVLRTGLDAETLATRLTESEVDAAFGSFTNAQSAGMTGTPGVTTRTQPGGTLRMLAFDFGTMPFGASTEEADSRAARAVRSAIADLVDREALAGVAPQLWTPEYGYIPSALRTPPSEAGEAPGEQGVLAVYGDTLGGPDVERATERLADADIETPVPLSISVLPRDDDPEGEALRAELVAQLETGGLFEVEIVDIEGPLDRATLSAERYPIFEYRWTPAGVGPDDYLTRLYSDEIGLPIGITDRRTEELLAEQAVEPDPVKRGAIISELEERLAARLPTLPLLSGSQTLYLAPGVSSSAVDDLGLGWFRNLTRR